MKRGLGIAERTIVPPVVAAPVNQNGNPAAQAPAQAVPPGAPEPAEAGQIPMPFPGPHAYAPRPLAMQDDAPENAATSSTASTAPIANNDNPDGLPPLLLAARLGRLAELEVLLENPELDINQFDIGTGLSALMFAAQNGHIDVLAALTAAGADLELVDQLSGLTTLGIALFAKQAESVSWLLEAGANVNAPQPEVRINALMLAAMGGDAALVRILLGRKDIALDQTDIFGRSALHLAARSNQSEVMDCLLTAGASITLRTSNGRTALDIACRENRGAAVDVLLQHGAVLPHIDFFDVSGYPFTITLADLSANQETPADTQANPLGLVDPQRLEQPLAFIGELSAVLESGQDLGRWLRSLGVRMACVLPVFQCLVTLPETWTLLANKGQEANAQQKLIYCASALSRLPVLTNQGNAADVYAIADLSDAGIERLIVVANRQISKFLGLAELAMTSLGSAMLEHLVQNCLASTMLAYEVDEEALSANLVNAGFLKPLAQLIATSWKSALAALEADQVAIPAGYSAKQAAQYLCDHISRKAPEIFAQVMDRELGSHALLAGLRKLIGPARGAEGLEMLFQIQCDQLRQYCAQLKKKD